MLLHPSARIPLSLDLNSGRSNFVWVEYNGDSDKLAVFVSSASTKPQQPVLTTTLDLRAVVGARAFFGFTAATGSQFQAHRLYSWRLNFDRPNFRKPTTSSNTGQRTAGQWIEFATAVCVRFFRANNDDCGETGASRCGSRRANREPAVY